MHKIPLFDLSRQHKKIKEKVFDSWKEVFEENRFTSGPETKIFEDKFAQLCKTKYSLGVHSGTDSLILALKSANIKNGDEIITTPCTFSASSDCVFHVGAKPVYIDVLKENGNINPDLIEPAITKKTKAILLVHLYGIPCEMTKIKSIAKKHNLIIIEDSSHAHGSLYKNQPVGSFGLAGCFSLYPSKSLGALGNAGIITSNKLSFIEKARMYANHGIKSMKNKYTHHLHGYNKLIDNIQASALIHKVPSLQRTINKKIKIANKYNKAFNKLGHPGMIWSESVKPSLYVYSVQVKKRKKIIDHFNEFGIDTGIYYPIPLHLQPSMEKLGYKKGDFPNSENFFNKTLSIPLYAELTDDEIDYICHAIEKINPKDIN